MNLTKILALILTLAVLSSYTVAQTTQQLPMAQRQDG